ncbi:MAG: cytochrome c3 family protein [Candidatus Aminicenantaceae bacterium]
MKSRGHAKHISRVCLLVFWLAASAGMASTQTIVGSPHDFSGAGWSGGEICLPCHTPHNADNTVPDAPLWNHAVTSATFTVYNSPTMDVTPVQPQGNSKLCLSCHDGTVALDSFGGSTGTDFIDAAGDLTTDLSDDHPVSVFWNHQTGGAGSGPYCNNCHASHNPGQQLSVLPFFDHYVECSTCHNVHNGTGNAYLLRLPLTGSTLCLYCHRK